MDRKIYFITLMLLIPALGVQAGNSKESMINDLYKKSGLEIQIKQLPGVINAYLDLNANSGLNKSDITGMKGIAERVFDPVVLEKTTKEHMARELDEPCITDVLKWLDSPLGMKITKLEEEGSTAESVQDIQAFALKLQESPPPNVRLALVKEFGESVHATDILSEIVVNSQFAAAVATMMSQPVEKRMPVDEIRKHIEKMKPKITAMLVNQFMISSLYTYRSLSDSELRAYITFAKSPSGTKYHAATIHAQKKSIVEFGVRIGEALGKKSDSGNPVTDI